MCASHSVINLVGFFPHLVHVSLNDHHLLPDERGEHDLIPIFPFDISTEKMSCK